MPTLYYIHDPMCSWCYGFKPVYQQLLEALPAGIKVERLLGGLAKDSEQVMPAQLQQTLQSTWQRIQQRIPGTKFNFDFWSNCVPRRSTYPACRAVIAARQQGELFDILMTEAIQNAYYLQARNPSDIDTLVSVADELGLDTNLFSQAMDSSEVESILQQEIAESISLGMEGMPSLVLVENTSRWYIPVDYTDVDAMLETINVLLEE